jgi:hypothetical protein
VDVASGQSALGRPPVPDRHDERAVTIHSRAAKDDEAADANSGHVDTQRRITSRHRVIGSGMLSLYQRSPGTVAAGSIAVLLAAAYLLAAPMGRDLSAQMAHAQLAEQHWPELLNLRWYGGFNPLGYSVLSPPVMAFLGVRVTTALAYVASVVLFAALLQRTAVARPVAGGIVGAVFLTGNLAVGRTTFGLALAIALGALLALVLGRLRISSTLSVLAALTSSVAGLFLGVVGGALFLAGRRRDGVVLGVSGLVPIVAIGLAFGNGGFQWFGRTQALLGFLGCLAVAALCWRRPVIRWGGFLSAGLVAAAYLIRTPVGTTATRLPELFAAPVLVAAAAIPLSAVIAAATGVVLLLPWSSITEVKERGDPALSPGFYAPLLDQLASRGAIGPIEVVPTLRRGEVAIVAPVVPIARGWSRPLDTGRHPIFYNGSLNADTYRQWLDDNAISHVALSNGRYDWVAPKEAALVRSRLPYLEEVWTSSTWTLYAVTNPRPVISSPGRVIDRDGASLTVSLPEAGEYVVRVHWSRYLSTSAGCVRPAEGGWTTLVVEQPGSANIKGSLLPRQC